MGFRPPGVEIEASASERLEGATEVGAHQLATGIEDVEDGLGPLGEIAEGPRCVSNADHSAIFQARWNCQVRRLQQIQVQDTRPEAHCSLMGIDGAVDVSTLAQLGSGKCN